MATSYSIPYTPGQLPDYSQLTPAQNAAITAILQQKGVLPPNTAQPYLPGGSCDPAVIGLMPSSQQGYAQSLCAQGKAGYQIGTGINASDLPTVMQGITALPSSLSAQAQFAAQPITNFVNSLTSIPWWVWAIGLAVGAIVVVDLLK